VKFFWKSTFPLSRTNGALPFSFSIFAFIYSTYGIYKSSMMDWGGFLGCVVKSFLFMTLSKPVLVFHLDSLSSFSFIFISFSLISGNARLKKS
jgi:hypothetical protein